MNAKQKAKELMFLFANKIQKYDTILYQKKLSKQCALLCVDEITLTCLESNVFYWQEVKKEIKNL